MKFSDGNVRAGKLTPANVLNIRELYHNQHYTQRALGNMYHVTTETIGRIVRGDTWKEYGGPGTERQPSATQNLHSEAEAKESLARLQRKLMDEGMIPKEENKDNDETD